MPVLRLLVLLFTCMLATAVLPASADQPPEKVRALLQMLADPEIQRWVEQQRSGAPAGPAAATEQDLLAGQIDAMRAQLAAIGAAGPEVPAALAQVLTRLRAELDAHGTGSVLVLAAAFAALGFGVERLFKDIVSGVLFPFDDAFRVGEYIRSGSYKGTVEPFGLRSARCRT